MNALSLAQFFVIKQAIKIREKNLAKNYVTFENNFFSSSVS